MKKAPESFRPPSIARSQLHYFRAIEPATIVSRKMRTGTGGDRLPPEIMTSTTLQSASKAHRHNKGLVLIAVYKFLYSLLFIALGVGALRLVGKDVGDILTRIAGDLRFNPEGRIVNFILDRASILDDPMLRRIGFAAFCYSAIGIAEAIGLYLEKAWGEYLTLIITASFLPWEIIEVLRRQTLPRISLLVVNALVLLFLIKVVWERQRNSKRVVPVSEPTA
jgi:uncharacterized membrane protein (DUF2068 family)